jgi:hypothetical protein
LSHIERELLFGLYRYRFNSLVASFIAHGLLDFLPVFWRP